MFKLIPKRDCKNLGWMTTTINASAISRCLNWIIVIRSASSKTYYDILGVNKTSTTQDIKDAFVRLSKEMHPDRDPNDLTRHSRFVQLNEAYTVLNKPYTRRLYDLSLEQGHSFSSWTTSASNMSGKPMSSANNMSEQPESSDGRRTYYEYSGFWDPNSQSNMNNKSYYGIKGLGRVPNSYIVLGCCVLLVLGSIGHFFAIRYSNKVSGEIMDAKDKLYAKEYKALKELTKTHGDAAQIEILKKRLAGN